MPSPRLFTAIYSNYMATDRCENLQPSFLVFSHRYHSLSNNRHHRKMKQYMRPNNGKQKVVDPEVDPEFLPAPLFSPWPPHNLPHLIDRDMNKPTVAEHQHDNLFWNSTLEERGEEVAPEYDPLGKAEGTRRTYWVKDVPRTSSAFDSTDNVKHYATDAQDAASGPSTPASSSATSQFSNWDLYAPPTRPWPKRKDSLQTTYFEPLVAQRSPVREVPDQTIGQDERPYDPNAMRGGGQVKPVQLNLPAHVLDTISAFAQADPMRNLGNSKKYVARPMVGFEVHRESESSAGRMLGTTPGEGISLKPSMAELYNESERPKLAPEPLRVAAEATSASFLEKVRPRHTLHQCTVEDAPDIADHPVLRNSYQAAEFKTINGDKHGKHLDTEVSAPTSFANAHPSSSRTNGVPIDVVEDSPSTDRRPSSPMPNGRSHFPDVPAHTANLPATSTHGHPSDHDIDDAIKNIMNPLNPRESTPHLALHNYQTILTAQASSIHHLNTLVNDLTDRRDYYEQDLLPRTLTHWTETNRENHALATAVRVKEEENALLWDLITFSGKLLDACRQRDEAVLKTVQMVRVGRMNRMSCALLERLVGSLVPGRGGARGDVKGRGSGTAESRLREDLEQVVLVCEQNLRVLGEDLEDWVAQWEVVRGPRREMDGDGQDGRRGQSEGGNGQDGVANGESG